MSRFWELGRGLHDKSGLLKRHVSQSDSRSGSEEAFCLPLEGTGTNGSIAILVPDNLDQFTLVRRQPAGIFERLLADVTQKAFSSNMAVRGNVVAADILMDAFFCHSKIKDYTLFGDPLTLPTAANRLQMLSRHSHEDKKVRIRPLSDVMQGGFESSPHTIWFNPIPFCNENGGVEVSYRVRGQFAQGIYPITTLFHGLSDFREVFTIDLRLLLEETLSCDSIVCTSRASLLAAKKKIELLAEEFERRYRATLKYRGRFDLIPLCVDTATYRPRNRSEHRKRLNLPNDATVFLYMGRLSTWKADLFPFLTMFARLKERNPRRRLLWLVSGTEDQGYTQHLLEESRRLNMANHVKVVLNPSDERKLSLYAAADVFVSPADCLQESFGLAPLEAMACGIPQIVADWDGYRDTVRHGETGFLVQTYWNDCHSDVAASGPVGGWMFHNTALGQSVAVDMGKAMEYLQILIDNEEMRNSMGQRSRERALSVYSYEAVVKQYESLWSELSSVARSIAKPTHKLSFDHLAYYEIFRHYATVIIDDRSKIRLSALGQTQLSIKPIVPVDAQQSLGTRFFEETIISNALDLLSRRAAVDASSDAGRIPHAPDEWFFGDLITALAHNHDVGRDCLRRHIMWLIKYSYVESINAPSDEIDLKTRSSS